MCHFPYMLPFVTAVQPWWNLMSETRFSTSWMINLLTASLAKVLLKAGDGKVGGVSPVVLFIEVHMLLSPVRKFLISGLLTSGLCARLTSVGLSVLSTILTERNLISSARVGRSSLIPGCWCWIFAIGAGSQCIQCCSRFLTSCTKAGTYNLLICG